MCIIVAKKKGVEVPDFETLKNCFLSNPDGAGFMYLNPKTKKVQIYKGFMNFKALQEKLEKVYNEVGDTKDVPFVYHFRIGTSGGNIPENTHPYPLGKNIDDYKKLDIECNIGVVHNGVISKYAPNKNNKRKMNDTQVYIYKKMHKYTYGGKYKTEKIHKEIVDETGSKFTILDTSGDLQIIGIEKFIEDKGVYYSNDSYLPYEEYLTKKYGYGYGYNYGYGYGGYDYGANYGCLIGAKDKYGSLQFKDGYEMQEAIELGKFISRDKVICDYDMYDEPILPANDYEFIEVNGVIYMLDYEEKRFDFVTDWYDIITYDEYYYEYEKTNSYEKIV